MSGTVHSSYNRSLLVANNLSSQYLRSTRVADPEPDQGVKLHSVFSVCWIWFCFVPCFGSGSAWTRIDLALPDRNLYWECVSGSRSKEQGNWPKLQINLFPAFQNGLCSDVGTFYDITYIQYIFHVKIQLFVTAKFYQDPVRMDPH
jgi:hypothetical protein